MTPLSSSSTLHLGTLNTCEAVVIRKLRDQVCQWEQDAVDAAARGEYGTAQQCKQWAFAADLVVSTALVAFSALVLDSFAYGRELVREQREVKLPEVPPRSPKDLALDVLSIEVASQQPEPLDVA